MATATPSHPIETVSFKDALGERYLAYALSTITARSLPDVRDGLKPVHRRLLYAMMQLKLDPASGYKKCARVVGDVIGKYHPHGDTAVYDTMVRLAQTFSVRYPLVDGQGNFGSIDGDNAAAMRYTEAKLTDAAILLMEDMDSGTVDFRPTYDGTESEPVVMPAGFPNLLANGAEGIAVGMACAIPPHNILELCDALVHLIKHPNASIETLVNHVQGPDFPTGGLLAESRATLVETYTNGRGSLRVRARWEKEQLSHGLYQVVITEIPYQVQKSKLIEKMAELFREKKLPLLANIQDESTGNVRIVLEPRSKNIDPELLMEALYRATDLEIRYGVNMNVLGADGIPRVMNLREMLQEFLNHRHEVLVRKSKNRLEQIARRLEIVSGFITCFLNLDEVIRIIREEDEPKPELMQAFDLSELQAESILNMRLRQLRKLEEMELKREHKELKAEQKALNALLKSDAERWGSISEEIKAVKKRFNGQKTLAARRTELTEAPSATNLSLEAFIEKEPITVVCSRLGWIRAFKGHYDDLPDLKFKEGDGPAFQMKAKTTDKLLLFATDGKFFTLPCDKLPGAKGQGEPVRLMCDLDNQQDIVVMQVHEPSRKLLLAADNGKGFVVEEADVLAQTRGGKQVLNVVEGSKAVVCADASNGDHVAVIGTNRKLLVFPLEQVPVMKRGQGVALQKYKGAHLADVQVFAKKDGLSWIIGERVRMESDVKPWLGARAGQGHLPPVGFPRSNKFSG
ncbi:MAG: DNA topoisomerase IV subunit A [Alphaproteobacteria bacterium]|nr:DNA topoisomerase IV subunit A [Alphaproteobacteria bacterium]